MDILECTKDALRLDSWHTPATDYPKLQVGNYRIHRKDYPRGYYKMNGIDDYVLFKVVKPIPVTTLQQRRGRKWYGWMVDDPPHWRSMQIYARGSKGRVLTTGLGLGLVIYDLIKNDDVTEIVVVEISPEVVQLISPHLPKSDKLKIVVDDFYHFIDIDNTQWDTIITDLWVSHNSREKLDLYYHEVVPTMVDLKIKYPEASLTAHGFYPISDIKFTSREMVDKIIELRL